MLLGAWLALLAAVLYGVSDFGGALAARRLRVFPATVIIYCAATVVALLALPVAAGPWSAGALGWGAAAGVFAVIGLLTFYAALASGSMSVMSVLIAAAEAAVPVIAAILIGQHLVWWAWLALAAAVVGGVLLSRQPSSAAAPTSIRMLAVALVSGFALGASVLSLDAAPHSSRVLPAAAEVGVGLLLLAAVGLLARLPPTRVPVRAMLSLLHADGPGSAGPSRWPAIALAVGGGALLTATNVVLVFALHHGRLAVVGVLVSLYPLSTILLSRVVLHERLTRSQLIGMIIALLACAALSLAH